MLHLQPKVLPLHTLGSASVLPLPAGALLPFWYCDLQTAGRHTFDGDGQVVTFSFNGTGRVRFTNKFVRTRGFLDEQVNDTHCIFCEMRRHDRWSSSRTSLSMKHEVFNQT